MPAPWEGMMVYAFDVVFIGVLPPEAGVLMVTPPKLKMVGGLVAT